MSVDIDVDVDTAICFLGARLPSHSDALHCTWRVCTCTRALEHPLLDLRSRSVEVALVLDLETTTALSLHELFDLLCRTLKRFPRSAGLTLSFGAMRPQERLQLRCKSFNRSDLTVGAHTETAVNNSRATDPVQSLELTCWAVLLLDSMRLIHEPL